MKRNLLVAAAIVVTSLTLVGCGGKPKIPENTVVAAYVQLDKSIENVTDVAKAIIKRLPENTREKAEKEFEDAKKTFEEQAEDFDFKWLCATVTLSKQGAPLIAAVVKCDYAAKNDEGQTLVDLAKSMGSEGETVAGVQTYATVIGDVAFVDDDYAVWANSKDALELMIDLYANGKGKTSDAFGDLTDIAGDTVARIQTCDVETLVKSVSAVSGLDIRKQLEDYAEKCDDEDLADDLLDIEGLTLDVMFSDDVIGARFYVDAENKDLAKAIEGAFNVLNFVKRLQCDASICAFDMSTLLPPGQVSKCGSDVFALLKNLPEREVKDFYALLRESLKVERSGAEVEATFKLDTDDLLDVFEGAAKKLME